MSSSRHIFRLLPWLDWPALLLISIVGFLSYHYEDFKEDFPRLITWQMHAYQSTTTLGQRKPQAKWVVPIEINDRTYYDFLGNESRHGLTDRRFLAELVNVAVESKAAVIALDINLDSEQFDRTKAWALNPDDQALFDAIRNAQRAEIPVVLTFGFRPDKKPIAHIFEGEDVGKGKGISFQFPEEEDPSRPYWVPRFGFDNPGDDFRKVPLVTAGTGDEGKTAEYYSFALQIVDAYQNKRHWNALAKNTLADSLAQHKFVYTTFMPAEAFVNPDLKDDTDKGDPLSGIEVFCNEPPGKNWDEKACPAEDSKRAQAARKLLEGRIVLIGGNRHGEKNEEGADDYLDDHESPVGPIRGMYLQANYVEGLLDNRVLYPAPRLLAAVLDVLLAVLVLGAASTRKGVWARTGLIAVLLIIPALLAWLAAVLFRICLDFVFPLVLLLLHPAIDGYIKLLEGSESEDAGHEIAARETAAYRHLHTVRHVERSVTDNQSPNQPGTQQNHEETVHESEESDLDEERS